MKIYFSYKFIPELSGLPEEWKQFYLSKYQNKAFLHWKTLLTLFICLPAAIQLRTYIPYFIDLYPNINPLYIETPLILFSSIFWIFTVFNVHVHVVRKYLVKDRTIPEKRIQITSGSR